MIRKAFSWLTGLPEVVWPILALLAVFGGVIWWDRWDDAQVVKSIEDKRAAASATAGIESAEDRADRVRVDLEAQRARELSIAKADAAEAAKQPEARSTVSAQQHALDCERLRQLGLTSGPNYKEFCQ